MVTKPVTGNHYMIVLNSGEVFTGECKDGGGLLAAVFEITMGSCKGKNLGKIEVLFTDIKILEEIK